MMIAARDPVWDGSDVEKLGDRVRRLRLEKGLTQDDLARLIGKKFLTINLIENHKTENPKADTIEALARELGTTSDYLLNGKETPETTYEPLDDESRPMVERLLDMYRFPAEKRAWVREHLPEFAYSTGATPAAVITSIEALAREYDYKEGTRLPPPERERVEEPKRASDDDAMIRPRNKKRKR